MVFLLFNLTACMSSCPLLKSDRLLSEVCVNRRKCFGGKIWQIYFRKDFPLVTLPKFVSGSGLRLESENVFTQGSDVIANLFVFAIIRMTDRARKGKVFAQTMISNRNQTGLSNKYGEVGTNEYTCCLYHHWMWRVCSVAAEVHLRQHKLCPSNHVLEVFFFCLAYLNAWLLSFIGYT